jgi:hypothetical protein
MSRSPVPVPVVLIYNETYVSIPAPVPHCPVPHIITSDRSDLDFADAVIFHIPTLESRLRLRKRPGQRWVALSAESDVVCLRLRDRAFMQQFDFTMTYRLDSDFPMPYVWTDMIDTLRVPPWHPDKRRDAVIFMSGRADLSFREQYVAELMRHMSVDSYGAVLRNRTLPVDEGRRTKLETISKYRFTLAFENSKTDDYVTEKFFDALLTGSVPVYLGASNVEKFAPGDGCYIAVSNFSGPRELARYLRHLAMDRAAYEEYLAWKERPLRPSFVELARGQRIHPVGRLCMWLAGYTGQDETTECSATQ